MKALTVRQPWAWAIVHGGKDVENRTQLWSYRGPLAVHAGLAPDTAAQGHWPPRDLIPMDAWRVRGAVIGVVDLVGVHPAEHSGFCCESDWAETEYAGRTSLVHLELANPRPLPEPIAATGKLGLWTPPADVLERLQEVTA